MRSIPQQSPFQGSWILIDDLRNLSDIAHSLDVDPSLAKQVTAIEVHEKEVDESELDLEGDPAEIAPEVYEKFGTDMSKVIHEVQKHGHLETFKWIGVDQKNARPDVFWESVWKTSSTLKKLSIEFSVHELDKLSKLVSQPPQIQFNTKRYVLDSTLSQISLPQYAEYRCSSRPWRQWLPGRVNLTKQPHHPRS
jgi:hypothetical protein